MMRDFPGLARNDCGTAYMMAPPPVGARTAIDRRGKPAAPVHATPGCWHGETRRPVRRGRTVCAADAGRWVVGQCQLQPALIAFLPHADIEVIAAQGAADRDPVARLPRRVAGDTDQPAVGQVAARTVFHRSGINRRRLHAARAISLRSASFALSSNMRLAAARYPAKAAPPAARARQQDEQRQVGQPRLAQLRQAGVEQRDAAQRALVQRRLRPLNSARRCRRGARIVRFGVGVAHSDITAARNRRADDVADAGRLGAAFQGGRAELADQRCRRSSSAPTAGAVRWKQVQPERPWRQCRGSAVMPAPVPASRAGRCQRLAPASGSSISGACHSSTGLRAVRSISRVCIRSAGSAATVRRRPKSGACGSGAQ